jgi:hypothetical protein
VNGFASKEAAAELNLHEHTVRRRYMKYRYDVLLDEFRLADPNDR